MRTEWLWSLGRFVGVVVGMMAAALALAAILGLFQGNWIAAAIQNVLYAGSLLFMIGLVFVGLQLFRANAMVRAGVPLVREWWMPWGLRALVAGFLVFLLGLWLQGTILGQWIELPAPPIR